MNKSKDVEAIVFEYLETQNRPYSVNDIVQNLHKELGKTAAQKALDKLVQDGKVREKTYGKQKVYLLDQSGLSEASPEELRDMDAQVVDLEKRIKVEDVNLKNLMAELKELNSSLTTEEAKAEVDTQSKQIEQLRAKHKMLSGSAVIVDQTTREASRAQLASNTKEWQKRKRLANNILEPVLDQCPLPKNLLYEEIGIETDEDAGVVPNRTPQ